MAAVLLNKFEDVIWVESAQSKPNYDKKKNARHDSQHTLDTQ